MSSIVLYPTLVFLRKSFPFALWEVFTIKFPAQGGKTPIQLYNNKNPQFLTCYGL